jgi:phosphate transport system substrate-binding protein
LIARRALLAALACALLAPVPLRAAETPPVAADEPLRVSAPASLLPLARRIADAYEARFDRKVAFVARGSRDGVADLRAGKVDVALADSPAASDDGLKQTTVAYAPLALIADPNSGVESLSSADARAILDGTLRTWKAVGGSDVPVVRFDRPTGSAADRIVTNALKLNPKRTRGEVDDTSAAIVADVRATRGAIGVVVLPYAGDLGGVRVLAIDGHAPDLAGARAGYPLLGAELAVTLGAPTLGISRFVAYLRSASDAWRSGAMIPMHDLPGR